MSYVSKYLKETHEGGSPRGFHFYGMAEQCWRKHYLCNVLCLKPVKLGRSLMLGKAIHCGLQAFYEHGFNSEVIVPAYFESMSEQYPLFISTEVYNESLEIGEVMLNRWIRDWAEYDKANYEIVLIEKEIEVPIEDTGMTFTIRPDRIMRWKKTGKLHGFDIKHTTYSTKVMADNVIHQDQASAYMWAYEKKFGEPVEKYIPDILYKNKGVCTTDRAYPIYRTKRELVEFEKGMAGLMTECTQKMKALSNPEIIESPEDVFYLFRRNPFCDGDGNWKCDYRNICRTVVLPGDVPDGYVIEEGKEGL